MKTLLNTTAKLVDHQAATLGDSPFLVEDGRVVSFSDFREAARKVAAAVIASGIQSGDRVAVWSPNRSEWAIAAFGLQYAGATLVTLNTRFKATEAEQTLNDSGAKLLFCIGRFLGVDYPATLDRSKLPALESIVVFGESDYDALSWNQFLDSAQSVDASTIDARRDSIGPDMPSDIIFTSGTTGRAKGVVTGHGQNLQAFQTFADLLGLESRDRYLVINPFFHSFGYKAGILAALSAGCALYPMAVFDTASVLEAIERDRITVMPGPPTLFQSLLLEPSLGQRDISSLAKATTGAATIPVALIEKMRSVLGIDTVVTAYGLSECCGLATMCRRGDDAETIATTSGCAIPDVELRVADERGNTLGRGVAGEIQIRGFNVMMEYFNNPEATREAITQDAWLHTGDIGLLDARGYLRITDRLKDMFICGGFNCYPAEIENALCAHPDVAVAAVVGRADERLGEVAHAFIIRTPHSDVSTDTLLSWSREQMANYKVPRGISFVDELPLNASGKVLKTQLREQLA